MPLKGLLFAVVGQVCVLGMVAGVARPQWFRMNGAVPSRWKISALWFVLALVCAVGALASGVESAPGSTPATESTVETTSVEPVAIDIAVPVDIDPGIQDAAKPAEAAPPRPRR